MEFFKLCLIPFFLRVVSRCGETNSQVLQGRLSFGRGCSAGCDDNFEVHASGALSGAGSAGRGEGDVDVAVAAARRGENNCNDHL